MSLATVTYSYDALGRPSGKTVTDANGSTLVDEDFDLDIHGWTNSIIAKDNVNRTFFRENLAYTNPPTPISVARYDGNISESSYFYFSYPDDTPAILNSFYSYSYDGMKRLVDAKHSNVSVFDNDLDTERHITYDRNGNITSLIRYSSDGGGEPLSFSHTGNRMTSVNGNSYSYDSAGNMTHDGRKGLDISYNCLNLPSHAATADGSSLTYTYLADGTKMLVTNSGRGFRYIGSFTYSVAGANNFALESIACDNGRYSLIGDDSSSTTLKDLFFVTDHLGNVRSIADVSPGLTAPVILEQNDYLPFGTKVQNSSYASITENRYRYAGKEEQNIGGINLSLLDFGARYYDPYAARWTSVDPMASKYLGISPYVYCTNNPIIFFDSDGREVIKSLNLKKPNPYDSKYKQANGYKQYQSDIKAYNMNTRLNNEHINDYSNILTFAAHGIVGADGQSLNRIILIYNNKEYSSGVKNLAFILSDQSDIVKSSVDNDTYSVIVLMACSTAQTGVHSLAAQMSTALNSLIIAPSGDTDARGNVDNGQGEWRIFYRGELLDTIPGNHIDFHDYLRILNERLEK